MVIFTIIVFQSKNKRKDRNIKKTNVNGEIFTTAVNFAILTLQELIEEREEK